MMGKTFGQMLGTPSGAAGGDLTGTYPNPSVDPTKFVTIATDQAVSGQKDFTGLNTTMGAAGAINALRRLVVQSNNADERAALQVIANNLSAWLDLKYDGIAANADALRLSAGSGNIFLSVGATMGLVVNSSGIIVGTTGAYLDSKQRHVLGDTATLPPTIAAGVGAGTTPTIAIDGSDMAGKITLTTGTLPTGTNAVIATITFGTTYATTSYPTLTPANALTAALSGIAMVFVTGNAATWVITSGTTALEASSEYAWTYSVGGK